MRSQVVLDYTDQHWLLQRPDEKQDIFIMDELPNGPTRGQRGRGGLGTRTLNHRSQLKDTK